ncbi:hypothetical protein AG1IA_07343 [Rhizoctonia solani AG-1 IA]|uniref:Uncharacterized protein n=1 Tax=Thanatephorus cucumeris (strain AG1-IA) TaxID=983506 RepID=L8WK86_THACA|nr:hypothetical protein AG1IA_07343 [Rhizoctonia solani AG-1 IA]
MRSEGGRGWTGNGRWIYHSRKLYPSPANTLPPTRHTRQHGNYRRYIIYDIRYDMVECNLSFTDNAVSPADVDQIDRKKRIRLQDSRVEVKEDVQNQNKLIAIHRMMENRNA